MDARMYPEGLDTVESAYDASGNLVHKPGKTSQQVHFGAAGVGGLAVYFEGSLSYKQAYWDGVNLFRVRGKFQVHNRGLGAAIGTSDAYAAQIKSEFNDDNSAHACVEITSDWKANGTTGGANVAVQGVSRLAATYTLTGSAALMGTYGQIANLGTINGSGRHAALYGLIEAGGVWTSVSRLAVAWLDSHLAAAPGAGELNFLEISNNAAAVFNSAIRIYPGNAITNLLDIETASGMVALTGTPGTLAGSIRLEVEGQVRYLGLYATPTGG